MTIDHLAPHVAPGELDEDEEERFTHIVLEALKSEEGDITPLGNSVVAGMIYGTPVRALCGAIFVPRHDPKKYPLCPACREIAESNGWRVPAQ